MHDAYQTDLTLVTPRSKPGEPTWEVARFFPVQGEWTESAYLALQTNQLVELSEGNLELLPMPTDYHQAIVGFLYETLIAFVKAFAPGKVRFSPLPVRLWNGKYREPDILYMRKENLHRITHYWEGADLVMEVVSPTNPDHDRDIKRREYAQAGIPEFWIIDVIQRHILVLALEGKEYREHGQFGPGSVATSVLLPGFTVPVDDVLLLVPEENL
jgi:Uma2 family endonuclease